MPVMGPAPAKGFSRLCRLRPHSLARASGQGRGLCSTVLHTRPLSFALHALQLQRAVVQQWTCCDRPVLLLCSMDASGVCILLRLCGVWHA
jgi:hypothetical protein